MLTRRWGPGGGCTKTRPLPWRVERLFPLRHPTCAKCAKRGAINSAIREKWVTPLFGRILNQGQSKCQWLLRAWGNRKHQELFRHFLQLRLLLEVILFVGTNTWPLIIKFRKKKKINEMEDSGKIRSESSGQKMANLLWNYKRHFCNCWIHQSSCVLSSLVIQEYPCCIELTIVCLKYPPTRQ